MRDHRIRPSQGLAACAAMLALGVAGCGSDSGSGSSSTSANANRPGRFSLTAAQRSCLQKAGVRFGRPPGGRPPGTYGAPPPGATNGAPPPGATNGAPPPGRRIVRPTAKQQAKIRAALKKCGINLPMPGQGGGPGPGAPGQVPPTSNS